MSENNEQPKTNQSPLSGGKTTLQRLYELEMVETVHAIASAKGVDISVDIGDNVERTLHLPEGSYLILRVTAPPVSKPGLYAIVAPRDMKPNGQKPREQPPHPRTGVDP